MNQGTELYHTIVNESKAESENHREKTNQVT